MEGEGGNSTVVSFCSRCRPSLDLAAGGIRVKWQTAGAVARYTVHNQLITLPIVESLRRLGSTSQRCEIATRDRHFFIAIM